MFSDRLLSQLLRDLTLKKNIESRHSSFSWDPRNSRLSIKLERDDLRTDREISVQEGIKNCPSHLRLGTSETDI